MILVTGASGFIGRCLFKELITQFGEHEVIALTSNPNFKENSVYFNFEDHPDSLKEKLKSLPIKIVIHAGAFTQKNKTDLYNWEGPNSNVIFTDILLKSLPNSVEKLIYLSTIDVYKMGDVISEQTAISPNNLFFLISIFTSKAKYLFKLSRFYNVLIETKKSSKYDQS